MAMHSVWFVALFEFKQKHENGQRSAGTVQCALAKSISQIRHFWIIFPCATFNVNTSWNMLAHTTPTKISLFFFLSFVFYLRFGVVWRFIFCSFQFVVILKLRTSGNRLAHHRWSAGDMRSIHSLHTTYTRPMNRMEINNEKRAHTKKKSTQQQHRTASISQPSTTATDMVVVVVARCENVSSAVTVLNFQIFFIRLLMVCFHFGFTLPHIICQTL